LTPYSLIEQLTRLLEPKPWDYAKAAVAILVKPKKNDLEFFLVKRAEVDDDPWSGDMAFPGGKKNPQDKTLIDTAVREVLEETSVDLRQKKAIGFMEPIYSSVRKTLAVQPVVYRFDEYPEIHLNYELTKYIWAPLSEMKRGKTNAVIKGWEGPVYQVQGETVWGLTFRMLEKLFKLLEED
jgi:8-oxo-dGTP pyrophosphatase MutT (NUDIX family)